jgi:hypothetical protein
MFPTLSSFVNYEIKRLEERVNSLKSAPSGTDFIPNLIPRIFLPELLENSFVNRGNMILKKTINLSR